LDDLERAARRARFLGYRQVSVKSRDLCRLHVPSAILGAAWMNVVPVLETCFWGRTAETAKVVRDTANCTWVTQTIGIASHKNKTVSKRLELTGMWRR